jgi:hypothetical protein
MSPARAKTTEALLISVEVYTGENFIILLVQTRAPFGPTQFKPKVNLQMQRYPQPAEARLPFIPALIISSDYRAIIRLPFNA